MISIALFAAAMTAMYMSRAEHRPLAWTGTERLRTPAMDIADERTRAALLRLQAQANEYRGQWLGTACLDGKADAPEIYLLSRASLSSHGPVDAIRFTVKIDSSGQVTHESLRTSGVETGRRVLRGFGRDEASSFRQLLVDGGYLSMPSDTQRRNCIVEFMTLQSCIEGRYYGVAQSCQDGSLGQLSDAIEAFALDEESSAHLESPKP